MSGKGKPSAQKQQQEAKKKKQAERLAKESKNAYVDCVKRLQEIQKVLTDIQKNENELRVVKQFFEAVKGHTRMADSYQSQLVKNGVEGWKEAVSSFDNAKKEYQVISKKLKKYSLTFRPEDEKVHEEVKGLFNRLEPVLNKDDFHSIGEFIKDESKSIFQETKDTVQEEMPAIDYCLGENITLSERLAALKTLLGLRDGVDDCATLFLAGCFGEIDTEGLLFEACELSATLRDKIFELFSKIVPQVDASLSEQLLKADAILGADYHNENYDKVASDLRECKNAVIELQDMLETYCQCAEQSKSLMDEEPYQKLLDDITHGSNEMQRVIKLLEGRYKEMTEYSWSEEYQGYLEQKENEEEAFNAHENNDHTHIPFFNFAAGTQQNNQQPQFLPFDVTQAMGDLNLNDTNQNAIPLNTINGVNEWNTVRFVNK